MAPDADAQNALTPLLGEVIVLDMSSRYVVLGTLESIGGSFLRLVEADVHDLRDTSTTRDSYVLDARRFGVSAGRTEAWIRIDDVVGVSRLDAVIV